MKRRAQSRRTDGLTPIELLVNHRDPRAILPVPQSPVPYNSPVEFRSIGRADRSTKGFLPALQPVHRAVSFLNDSPRAP